MIVVVLFTLLLLAGILAATLRLSLGSRQNTADQAATLRAQYTAESEFNRVVQRLRDYQSVLTPTRPGPNGTTVVNLLLPPTTTKGQLENYALQFCNKPLSPDSWQSTSAFATARSTTDNQIYTDAKECLVSGSNAQQFELLAKLVTPSAYDLLPAGERPRDVNDEATRLAWWSSLLSTEQTGTNWKLNLRALRAVQLNPVRYRFYFGTAGVKARGADGAATRVITAGRATDGDWWIEVVLPSLLQDVLMTNHHRSLPSGTYDPAGEPEVSFNSQQFDGSVHTNEKFLFSRYSTAQFRGKVSSVGCTDLPENGRPTSGDCTKSAGVYIGNATSPLVPPDSENTDERRDKWVADQIVASTTNVSFVKTAQDPAVIDYTQTDFTADYRPLPENANDQVSAANSAGLNLEGEVVSLDLKAANGSGASPTSPTQYTNDKWTETAGDTYQYITVKRKPPVESCSWSYSDDWSASQKKYIPTATYTQTSSTLKRAVSEYANPPGWFNGGTYTRYQLKVVSSCQMVPGTDTVTEEYRYGPDKKLYKKPSGGTWAGATVYRDSFNGVIYGTALPNVAGPARLGSDTTGALNQAPPALASFAQLTLASSGNITINSDLTMSESPCTFAATKANPPCTRRPSNVLGLYSQSGDIIISDPAPKNINIHAALMASTGQVTAQNYDTRTQNGNVNLVGSLIENWYGAFGTFNSSTGASTSGYGRNFTYDSRLSSGIEPPFFPVSPRWNVIPASDMSKSRLFNVLPINAKASDF